MFDVRQCRPKHVEGRILALNAHGGTIGYWISHIWSGEIMAFYCILLLDMLVAYI